MKRYLIILEGRVQGVGFRHFSYMNAKKYSITGTVRNLYNGMVELVIQGDKKNLDIYIDIIKKGDRFIRIDDLSIKELDVINNEKEFRVIF